MDSVLEDLQKAVVSTELVPVLWKMTASSSLESVPAPGRFTKFYLDSDEAYVFLSRPYKDLDSENNQSTKNKDWSVYYWVGVGCSSKTNGATAYRAVEIKTALEKKFLQSAAVLRIEQATEEEDLAQLFPSGYKVLSGPFSQSWHRKKDITKRQHSTESTQPILEHLGIALSDDGNALYKVTRRFSVLASSRASLTLQRVPSNLSELDAQNVLLLIQCHPMPKIENLQITRNCQLHGFLWFGTKASAKEKGFALEAISHIKRNQPKGIQVETINQGEEPSEFLLAFGVEPEPYQTFEGQAVLYQLKISDTAEFDINEVPVMSASNHVLQVLCHAGSFPTFSSSPSTKGNRSEWPRLSMLKHDCCYILDCWTEVFTWGGRECCKGLKQSSNRIAQALAKHRPKAVMKICSFLNVVDGAEPFLFKVKFVDWATAKHYEMAKCITPQGFEISSRQIASTTTLPPESVQRLLVERLLEDFGVYVESPEDCFLREAGAPDSLCNGEVKIYLMEGASFISLRDARCCGHFQSDKSYLIYFKQENTESADDRNLFEILYFWHGLDAPKKNKLLWGLSQEIAHWRMTKWGGRVPVLQISQGLEPLHFRQIFQTSRLGRLCYHSKSLEVNTDETTTVLYEAKGLVGDQFQVSQILPQLSSLCSQAVFFCIHFQRNPRAWTETEDQKKNERSGEAWFWAGKKASTSLLQHAGDASMLLLEYYSLPANLHINIIQEKDLSTKDIPEAWDTLTQLLGGKVKGKSLMEVYPSLGEGPGPRGYFVAQLYVTDTTSGVLQLKKKSFYSQDTLTESETCVAVLDAWEAVYIWSSSKAPQTVKAQVVQAAQEYIGMAKGTRQVVVLDDSTNLPPLFCSHFTGWKSTFAGFVDPYTRRYQSLVEDGRVGEAVLGHVVSPGNSGMKSKDDSQHRPSSVTTSSKIFLAEWRGKRKSPLQKNKLKGKEELQPLPMEKDQQHLQNSTLPHRPPPAQKINSELHLASTQKQFAQAMEQPICSSDPISSFLPYRMEQGYSNDDLKYFLGKFATLDAELESLIWLKLHHYNYGNILKMSKAC